MADPFHAEEYALSQAVPLSSITFSNNGVRNQPINPTLAQTLQQAVTQVYGPDYRVDVMSGAQPAGPRGTAGTTGSRRHGTGDAADVWVYSPSGDRLQGDQLLPLSQYWLSSGNGSVGFPANGANSLHLDLIGGTGPGAIPLGSGEGKLWYYGTPTASQRSALSSAASHPAPPRNIPQVATAEANTSAPQPAIMSASLSAARVPAPGQETVADMYKGIYPPAGPAAQAPMSVADMYAGIYPSAKPVQTGGLSPTERDEASALASAKARLATAKVTTPTTQGLSPTDRDEAAALAAAQARLAAAPTPQTISPALDATRSTPAAQSVAPQGSGHFNPRTGQEYSPAQWTQVSANQQHTASSIATTGQAKTDPMVARLVGGAVGNVANNAAGAAKTVVAGAASTVGNSVGNFLGSFGSMFGQKPDSQNYLKQQSANSPSALKPIYEDVQVPNPEYTKYLTVPDGQYNYVTPDIKQLMNETPEEKAARLAAARPAAPPKMITVRRLVAPAANPAQLVAPVPAVRSNVLAPAAAAAPVASTNGYTYVSNGSGGYTRVGSVAPGLTPAQLYDAANAGNTANSGGGMPSYYSTDNHGGGGSSLTS